MIEIPLWAVEIKTMVARIDAKLDAHLEAHRELRHHQSDNEMRKLAIFGVSIGVGIAGGGTALLKLIGF